MTLSVFRYHQFNSLLSLSFQLVALEGESCELALIRKTLHSFHWLGDLTSVDVPLSLTEVTDTVLSVVKWRMFNFCYLAHYSNARNGLSAKVCFMCSFLHYRQYMADHRPLETPHLMLYFTHILHSANTLAPT